jgi:hypothetical protein
MQRCGPAEIPVATEDQNSHAAPSISVTARFRIRDRKESSAISWDEPENAVKERFGFPKTTTAVTESMQFDEDFDTRGRRPQELR